MQKCHFLNKLYKKTVKNIVKLKKQLIEIMPSSLFMRLKMDNNMMNHTYTKASGITKPYISNFGNIQAIQIGKVSKIIFAYTFIGIYLAVKSTFSLFLRF